MRTRTSTSAPSLILSDGSYSSTRYAVNHEVPPTHWHLRLIPSRTLTYGCHCGCHTNAGINLSQVLSEELRHDGGFLQPARLRCQLPEHRDQAAGEADFAHHHAGHRRISGRVPEHAGGPATGGDVRVIRRVYIERVILRVYIERVILRVYIERVILRVYIERVIQRVYIERVILRVYIERVVLSVVLWRVILRPRQPAGGGGTTRVQLPP